MSVCLSDRYLLLEKLTRVDVLYMVRSGIYPEVSPFMFKIFPAHWPDAIIRKPDTIEKTRTKLADFRGFWKI